MFSCSEIQGCQLPTRSRARAAASCPARQVCSQPGTGCLDCERVKVSAPELGARHKQCVSGILGVLSLPCLPVLGCQSPVTCPHISSVVHITGLSAKQLMSLGSKLSIIFVSLLCSGNILAHRNKETWTTMAFI